MGFLKVVKFILKVLSNICYILIALYFFVSFPTFLGYKPLVVLSGSMSPTYEIGTVIYYEEVAIEDIKEMDVITFSSGSDSNVTHRVTGFIDGKIQTKGDANISPDSSLVQYDEVKGRVIDYKLPIVGYYIRFVNENLYLVGIVIIILIAEFFIENMKCFDIKKRG